MEKGTTLEKVTFGGGCFWCAEAIFLRLKGVMKVVSGYSGGSVPNPSYEQVCAGHTGHAEVVQIQFDPRVIPYEKLVEVFFATHDPTQLNRQGNDMGEQYRSVIFYHSEDQRRIAEAAKTQTEKDKIFQGRIVTEITPFTNFYPAEEYHRDYYANNQEKPYCQAVISPKLAKFRERFKAYLNESMK